MKDEDLKKSFKFHIPVELIKSKNEEDDSAEEWKVQGIASTDDEDLQGETVDQVGMDISMLKAGRGLFNWDHQKGPENVLGQIEDADFVDYNGKKSLLVKGYLFKYQDRAKAFYNILKSVKKSNGPRVHMSIEGKILERDFRNPKAIKKARIEKVALTLDPVNPYTYTELVKSLNAGEVPATETGDDNMSLEERVAALESALSAQKALVHSDGPESSQPPHELKEDAAIKRSVEVIDHEALAQRMREEHKKIESEITKALKNVFEKALAAGAGSAGAPESMSGGEPMIKESLDRRVKNVTHKKRKKLDKSMIQSVIEKMRKAFPEHDPLDLAGKVIETFLTKTNEGDDNVG